MFTLQIDDETAKKLQAISVRENRSLSEVVSTALEQYDVPVLPRSNWALKMAQMAAEDNSIEWDEAAATLSENSREILDGEFGDHLLKHMDSKDE